MSDTDGQLHDALTARAVAERTLMEALLNRVAAIVTAEQIARLDVVEQVDIVRATLAQIAADQATFHSAVLALLDRLQERGP